MTALNPVPKDKLRLYPHMMPNDIAIWERYLAQNPLAYDYYQYDIHVGEGYGYDETSEDWHVRLAQGLTQFRIDAVGYKGSLVTIFEVKPYAGLSCLGQLLGYYFFFRQANPTLAPPYMAAVTDSTNPDMRLLFQYHGIQIYEVGF